MVAVKPTMFTAMMRMAMIKMVLTEKAITKMAIHGVIIISKMSMVIMHVLISIEMVLAS